MPVEASVAAILRPTWPRLAHAGDDDPALGGRDELDGGREAARQDRSRPRCISTSRPSRSVASVRSAEATAGGGWGAFRCGTAMAFSSTSTWPGASPPGAYSPLTVLVVTLLTIPPRRAVLSRARGAMRPVEAERPDLPADACRRAAARGRHDGAAHRRLRAGGPAALARRRGRPHAVRPPAVAIRARRPAGSGASAEPPRNLRSGERRPRRRPAEPPAHRRPGARRRPRRRALAERRARGAAASRSVSPTRRSGAGAPPQEAGRGGSLCPARTASWRAHRAAGDPAEHRLRHQPQPLRKLPQELDRVSDRRRGPAAERLVGACAHRRDARQPTASTRTSRAQTGRKARASSACASTSAAIRRSMSKGASSSTRSGPAAPTSTPP